MNTNNIRNRLISVGRALLLGLSFFFGQAQAQVAYDGIYLWSSGNFLSLHQDGTNIIATIYFNKEGNFTFPATAGGGTLPVPQIDVFDLMSGQVTGSTATIYGTRFHRACNVGYSLTFNADATITVTRTGHSNTAAADSAGISCSAILGAEATTLNVPKIRFNPEPTGPLAKYIGTWSECDSNHTKYIYNISAAQNGNLNIAPVEITYQNANCTGAELGTYRWSSAASASYLSTVVAPVSSRGALPASLTIDKLQFMLSNVIPSVSGPAVTGNCITYPNGSFCYDLATLNKSTLGGIYLSGNTLYELELVNGVYTLLGTYTKN